MNNIKIAALILVACLSTTLSIMAFSTEAVTPQEVVTSKPIEILNKPIHNIGKILRYTKADAKCLARNIYFEARNESILGQHYVAWVTLNRVDHKQWPNNICDVVWQHRQFSWTQDGKSDTPRERRAWHRAKLIALDTIYEANNGGKDISNGALFYHADYVAPVWRTRLVKITQIDRHIFYKHK